MLFPKRFWPGLADGTVTVAFRRWKRPTVKAGGTLRSAGGFLAIDAVQVIDEGELTDDLARRAGYADLDELRRALGPPTDDRALYRIDFHAGGTDPRTELRNQDVLSDDDIAELAQRLARLDRAAPAPWTMATLRVISAQPAIVSTVLAAELNMDRAPFKLNVRKLKALGLTQSLEVGYRLSPRGRAYLEAVR